MFLKQWMDPRETKVLKLGLYTQTPGKLPSFCRKCFTEGRPGTVASSTNGWSLASLGAREFFYENVTFKISHVSIDDTVSAKDLMCFTTERLVNNSWTFNTKSTFIQEPLPSRILTKVSFVSSFRSYLITYHLLLPSIEEVAEDPKWTTQMLSPPPKQEELWQGDSLAHIVSSGT